MTAGFLAVDKPGGMSSNQVVSMVKRATDTKKVGHAGTLDPMATGLLVVGIGKVTRLIRYIQEQSKEYYATAQFGVATDSLDADGAVLDRVEMDVTEAAVTEVATRFVGDICQVPPMVSALKHEGKRLYDLARAGVEVERQPRVVTVHELEITSVGPGPYPLVEFRVVCGKGTYVRSLADDMARALGGPAHLTALRRTRTGSFSVDRAVQVDALEGWRQHLSSPSQALDDLPLVEVDDQTASGVRNGMKFVAGDLVEIDHPGPYRVTDGQGDLLAVYRRVGDMARPEVVLPS